MVVLPELDRMVGDGLITMERVQVIAYRAGDPGRVPTERWLTRRLGCPRRPWGAGDPINLAYH